jgi:linoleoyl-CoA desaturase
MERTLKFTGKDQRRFFATVKQRVDAYFKDQNISKYANGEMYFKTLFFGGGAAALYLTIMLVPMPLWAMWGTAIVLGMFMAFIGFNIGHDAIHGSYSSHAWVNKLVGYSFNLIGGNDEVWRVTHNLVHHTYTNIPGHDEDIEVAPGLIRLSPEEKLRPHMRYQHLYAFPLYGLASLSWAVRKDYVKFFKKKIGETPNKHKPIDYFTLFLFKGVHYALFMILPWIFLDITWWQFLIGFLSMHLACGLTLGLVFQLAHVVEGTEFPYPNGEGNIEEAWAIHQMQTTADFARNSWLANFLCGGLNMQIEHHLFPYVCHTHYRELSKIVEATAKEFGVPYIDNPTFWGATQSHYRMLKKFGKEALENLKHQEMQPATA